MRDEAVVRGEARFAGDLVQADALALVFLVSTAADARVRIDPSTARSAPGVAGVFTAADLDLEPIHEIAAIPEHFAQPPLARDSVRYVGEYLAAVVADTEAAAIDAAELVIVDYLDPGPTPADTAEADAAEGLTWARTAAADAFAAADVTVRAEVGMPRLAVAPLEGRAALAVPGRDGTLTLWLSTQSPHWSRVQMARTLRMPVGQIRVLVPRVGGGFGGKANGGIAAYAVVAAVARRLHRPVRFVEHRTQNLTTMQGRGVHLRGALHARADGTIVGLELDERCDAGAYPTTGSVEPGKTELMACGPYRVPAVRFAAESVCTTRAPTGAYRGPGRSEASAVLERLLDQLARDLALDPIEVRRRNLVTPAELPTVTASGAAIEDADPPRVLDALLAAADLEAWRAEQIARRGAGDRRALGIGLATALDSTAWFARTEGASVTVTANGTVRVDCGTASAGQAHARAFATVVSEVLPVAPGAVVVVAGDTARLDYSGGSSGSRSLQLAGSAIRVAAEQVWDDVRAIAAELLEAAPEDVIADGERAVVRGVPARGVTLAEIAERHAAAPEADTLDAHCIFEQPGATHTSTAHLSVVEVDLETGAVAALHHESVTDCGRVVDPESARGQIVGATAQAMGQVLFEEFVYDEADQPRTATLADYLVPSAAEVPAIDAHFVTTPTGVNPLGARGVGEVGMVGAPAAIHAAVLDALAPYGVTHVDLPCTPERVWRALRDAHRPTEDRSNDNR
jgi:carbon-monoxide dehydrogenase large subunit